MYECVRDCLLCVLMTYVCVCAGECDWHVHGCVGVHEGSWVRVHPQTGLLEPWPWLRGGGRPGRQVWLPLLVARAPLQSLCIHLSLPGLVAGNRFSLPGSAANSWPQAGFWERKQTICSRKALLGVSISLPRGQNQQWTRKRRGQNSPDGWSSLRLPGLNRPLGLARSQHKCFSFALAFFLLSVDSSLLVLSKLPDFIFQPCISSLLEPSFLIFLLFNLGSGRKKSSVYVRVCWNLRLLGVCQRLDFGSKAVFEKGLN